MNGEVKWKAGDALVNRHGQPSVWPAMFEGNDERQRHYEHGGWRLKDQPVERQLAPGWTRSIPTLLGPHVWLCSSLICFGMKTKAVYASPELSQQGFYGNPGACESCAQSMGVFAAPIGVSPVGSIPFAAAHAAPSVWRKPTDEELLASVRSSIPIITQHPDDDMDTIMQSIATPDRCSKCAHRHIGPCDGTSPNGEFSCPCGDLTAKDAKLASRGAYAVGKYDGTAKNDPWQRADTTRAAPGAAATLLANLAREKAPAKACPKACPKVRDIYRPGNDD